MRPKSRVLALGWEATDVDEVSTMDTAVKYAARLDHNGQPGRLFFARIGGQTRRYPFREGLITVAIGPSPNGPAVFRELVDSRFAGKTWIVRENAEHAKSKTYRRADLFPGSTRV